MSVETQLNASEGNVAGKGGIAGIGVEEGIGSIRGGIGDIECIVGGRGGIGGEEGIGSKTGKGDRRDFSERYQSFFRILT